MLSHLRRGHHPELDGAAMPTRSTNGHAEHRKPSERINPSPLSGNMFPDAYPSRSTSALNSQPDLSRATRYDAHLLAIVRIEDKRNAFYSAEVVSKLRQKERTQSFINKPCCLYVTDRFLIVFDRASQVIAETIPLENVDPTCVHADVPDTLNDIFMYRLLDRHITSLTSHGSSTSGHESSPVVVFKCSNNDARALVDCIRTTTGKPLKHSKSAHIETHNSVDRRINDQLYTGSAAFTTGAAYTGAAAYTAAPGMSLTREFVSESSRMNAPAMLVDNHHSQTITRQSTIAATDYYQRLTEELNKCFDDIELFVRYLEALMEYTKELERDHRRKDKRTTVGLKHMIEKLPDDHYFIDILQKFRHSFNLLGELKHIIHNPNAPELVHYLLSPLQFILYTLRTKHANQLELAQGVWTPALTRDARDLLLNCLTSKEHEILRNLGPAWIRAADDSAPKFADYRPIFFEGRAMWIPESSSEMVQSFQPPLPPPIPHVRNMERTTTNTSHPFNHFEDQQQQGAWTTTTTTTRQANPTNTNHVLTTNQTNNNHVLTSNAINNGLAANHNTTFVRQASPAVTHVETTTVERGYKNGVLDDYNANMQNEHAWAIERKRAGAKICAVKIDRKGQNNKELTVRRGELIEIEDNAKKWWRARNFQGDVGHVPNNILEEVEIEHRPTKVSSTNLVGINANRPLSNTNSRSRYN